MALKKLLQLVSLIGAVFSACFDNGDKEIGGSCYKFVPQKLTFADAQYWCHYQNPVTSSYLAYMPNQFTSNFLASYARSAFETDDGNFWIGLSRKNSSSPWIWDNGQSLAFSNFGGQLGQNFAAESIVNAKWNAFGSTDKKFFVCSYDPQAPPTFGPPVTDIPMSTVPVSTEVPPTPTDDTSCSPTTYPQTFLFAYSNDLSSDTVWNTWTSFVHFHGNYSWFGSVRFDTKNMDIQFHTSLEDQNGTIANNLPDPNQGFQDSSIGSNVFDAIEKYFSNTEVPVCGSNIFILLKRYPNEVDVSRLVSLICSHHAILHVMTSTTPSGGSQPKAMYSIATKTNGMGVFVHDFAFWATMRMFPLYDIPYPVYATTTKVSGSGTKTFPDFHPSTSGHYWVSITFQDHFPDDSFQKITLRWANSQDSGDIFSNSGQTSVYGNYKAAESYWYHLDYNMTLDYYYLSQDVQNLQIRFYTSNPPSNWLPYSD